MISEETGATPDINAHAGLVPVHTAFEHKFYGRICAAAGSQVRTARSSRVTLAVLPP